MSKEGTSKATSNWQRLYNKAYVFLSKRLRRPPTYGEIVELLAEALKPHITEEEKVNQAERFILAYEDYAKFKNEFMDTFNLNGVQCVALSRLCELAKEYGEEEAKRKAANLTTDELFRIYDSEV